MHAADDKDAARRKKRRLGSASHEGEEEEGEQGDEDEDEDEDQVKGGGDDGEERVVTGRLALRGCRRQLRRQQECARPEMQLMGEAEPEHMINVLKLHEEQQCPRQGKRRKQQEHHTQDIQPGGQVPDIQGGQTCAESYKKRATEVQMKEVEVELRQLREKGGKLMEHHKQMKAKLEKV